MELMNEFEVDVPVDQTWAALTDLTRLTPCVPGARLDEVDGHELRGVLAVKVGPIDAHYEGRSAFVELDRDKRRIVLSVTGHDTDGQGDATASITLDLDERPSTTGVSVVADLSVTGKVAQFGRGVLAEVSNHLMDEFVANLQAAVAADETGRAAPSAATGSVVASAAAVRGASQPGVRASSNGSDLDAESGAASSAAGDDEDSSRLTKAVVAVGAAVAVVAFGYLLRRRGRKRSG